MEQNLARGLEHLAHNYIELSVFGVRCMALGGSRGGTGADGLTTKP